MTRKSGDFWSLYLRLFLDPPRRLLRVDRLAPGQHRDELRDPRDPGLSLLRVMGAVKDGVAIFGVEALEEGRSFLVPGKRCAQIVGHRGRTRSRIGPLPAAIGLGAVDLPQSGRAHLTKLRKLQRAGAIFLRPDAGRLPGREADQPILVVETVELAVDPAVAKRGVNRLVPRNTADPGGFPGDFQPQAPRTRRLRYEPGIERRLRFERD